VDAIWDRVFDADCCFNPHASGMARLDTKTMIRFWPLLLPLLVAATLLLSSCTTSEKVVTECSSMPMSQWIADTVDRNPLIAIKYVHLKDDQISVFMAAYNASPPESNFEPDEIVIFTSPGDPRGIVGLAKDGCLKMAHAYPLPIVSSWMAGKPIQAQPKNSNKSTI